MSTLFVAKHPLYSTRSRNVRPNVFFFFFVWLVFICIHNQLNHALFRFYQLMRLLELNFIFYLNLKSCIIYFII